MVLPVNQVSVDYLCVPAITHNPPEERIHMLTLGIDIGSTTSKCVILENGVNIVARSLVTGGIGTSGPGQAVEAALSGVERAEIHASAVTGYGRKLYEHADRQISELTCHGLGAHLIFPDVRTIIDIGGQDAKVISLDNHGRMQSFLMNDKCAAGTGRFLDVMSGILQIPISDLAKYAELAQAPASISSTCTVFAESEVISRLASGVKTDDLVAGICISVAERVGALAKRLGVTQAVCMSGGVAHNGGVRSAMENTIGSPILYSPDAQLFGAIGAAIYAANTVTQ